MKYDFMMKSADFVEEISDLLHIFEAAFWIALVINIIVLVAFFILCNHVAKLKKGLLVKGDFKAQFNFYYSIGDMDRAKECLFKQIINDEFLNEAFFTKANYTKEMRGYFLKRYQPYLEMLDLKCDFDKVDDFFAKLTSE